MGLKITYFKLIKRYNFNNVSYVQISKINDVTAFRKMQHSMIGIEMVLKFQIYFYQK